MASTTATSVIRADFTIKMAQAEFGDTQGQNVMAQAEFGDTQGQNVMAQTEFGDTQGQNVMAQAEFGDDDSDKGNDERSGGSGNGSKDSSKGITVSSHNVNSQNLGSPSSISTLDFNSQEEKMMTRISPPSPTITAPV